MAWYDNLINTKIEVELPVIELSAEVRRSLHNMLYRYFEDVDKTFPGVPVLGCKNMRDSVLSYMMFSSSGTCNLFLEERNSFIGGLRREWPLNKWSKEITELDPMKVTVEFRPRIDWKPGDLGGNVHSCWWGGKSNSRKMLLANGGGALILSHNGLDFGRVWYAPYKDGLALFNFYHNYKKYKFSERPLMSSNSGLIPIAVALGLAVNKDVVFPKLLVNNGEADGKFHINNGRGVLVGCSDVTHGIIADLNYPLLEVQKCAFCRVSELEAKIEFVEWKKPEVGKHWACSECAENYLDVCSYDLNLYEKSELLVGPDGFLYYTRNIKKVKEFVWVNYLGDLRMKSDCKIIGKIDNEPIYALKVDNKEMCKCGRSIVEIGETCQICKIIEGSSSNGYVKHDLGKYKFLFESTSVKRKRG